MILIGRYAIKLPKLTYGWQMFLQGLIANMQEAAWRGTDYPEMCPVIWSLPGGWCVVMRRADPLSEADWNAFEPPRSPCSMPDYIESWTGGDYVVPAEMKPNSFGKLGGRIVAIDYGN